ncbi:sulfatase [Carboxylicivirga sp. N1Y132]|uniref:Sulfatase n=1 Tax=Carboxylicivirga marina TaxID=2800988 RepID=A0ABS1HNZ2_9BACT|nr:sulfatase [Carboxylicivirga marina]
MLKIIALIIFGICFSSCKTDEKPPNILFIMADDHDRIAISAYESYLAKTAPTPSIDRLANEGLRMNHVLCTNAICTPSRAAILTGQYSQVNGVYTLHDDYNSDTDNLVKQLQRGGYETAIVGKWHLHKEPKGFDYYNVLPGQGKYFNPKFKEIGTRWQDHNEGGEIYDGYVTDVTTDIALNWLNDRSKKDKPFFLMLHHKAPHGLWEYPEHLETYLENTQIPEPSSLYNNVNHGPLNSKKYGTSISLRNSRRNMVNQTANDKWPTGRIDTTDLSNNEKTSLAYQKYLKDYLRCVKSIDDNVGRVLDYLDKNNLAENTIVVYTSDQGQFLGQHDYFDKRWMYEEPLHMPFLVRYPNEIEAGTDNSDICLNIDFAPTFLDYANIKKPNSMQGESFRSNLRGETPNDWRQSMYYRYWMHMAHHDNPAHYGIRTKRYKLIFFYGLPLDANGAVADNIIGPYWELYDLKNDPSEMNNVYAHPDYADIIVNLKQELLQLKKQYRDEDSKYPLLEELRLASW